jgi:hypothetical protein
MLISGVINFHISKQLEIFQVMCSYEEISKKNYKGKTLKINTHAIPVMGQPTALHAEQFAEINWS